MIDFFAEWEMCQILESIKKTNSIPINLPCKRRCIFCYFLQRGPIVGNISFQNRFIPPKFYPEIAKSLDYSKQIDFSTGDIFDYDFIYDLLEVIGAEQKKRREGGKLMIVSTFSCFDVSKIEVLKKLDATIQLSLITFDTNLKKELMGGNWTEHNNDTLKKVISSGILTHISVWYLGDLDMFKRDLELITSLIPKNKPIVLNLSYPCSTQFSLDAAKDLSRKSLAGLDSAIKLLLNMGEKNHNLDINFIIKDLSKYPREASPYQKGEMDSFSNRINDALSYLTKERIDLANSGFVTVESVYHYAKEKFPTLNWIKASLEYFQGDMSSCDLLTFQDIESAIKQNPPFSTYILSKDMLAEGQGITDLMGVSKNDFEKRIGSKVLFF